MEKLDLTKKYKAYYSAKPQPEILELEQAQFLSITGKGDPSGEAYMDHVQALYATAYTVKFMCKDAGKDFTVPKLEGLWHFDTEQYGSLRMEETPQKVPRSEWSYRMLIRMPDYVNGQQVRTAVELVVGQKKILQAQQVELYTMQEGKVVQMLHVGPFDKEPETLAIMMNFMQERGLQQNGLHHEIYLSDFRKTVPEKLKTILREPVR